MNILRLQEPKQPVHFIDVDWDRVGVLQAKFDLDTEAPISQRSRPEVERLCKAALSLSHEFVGVDLATRRQIAKYDLTSPEARSVINEFLTVLKQWAYDARRQYARNHPPPYPWGHWRDIRECPVDELVLFIWAVEPEGAHRPVPGFRRRGGCWQPLGGKPRREAVPTGWLDLPRLPSV